MNYFPQTLAIVTNRADKNTAYSQSQAWFDKRASINWDDGACHVRACLGRQQQR
jgi:hypothetical protein